MYELTKRQKDEFRDFLYQKYVVDGIQMSLMFIIVLAICASGSIYLGVTEELGKAFLIIGGAAGLWCLRYVVKLIYSVCVKCKASRYGYVCCPGEVDYAQGGKVYVGAREVCTKYPDNSYIGQRCMVVCIPFEFLPDAVYMIPMGVDNI